MLHSIKVTHQDAVVIRSETRKTLIFQKYIGILLDYAGDSPSFFVHRWQLETTVASLPLGDTNATSMA